MNELTKTELDDVSGGAIFIALVVYDFAVSYAAAYAVAKIVKSLK